MDVSPESIVPAICHTWHEIHQQPDIWPTTHGLVKKAVEKFDLKDHLACARVLITGAGTSAYAASAIAAAWPKAVAVPSTDLLVDTEGHIEEAGVLISIARSGNSPESIAVVNRVHKLRPEILQLAITCNPSGALATTKLVRPILLDQRTNDKSLVMTSSFSNLALGGLSLAQGAEIDVILSNVCKQTHTIFDEINSTIESIASTVTDRVVMLASSPLFAWAQEGSLKSLEMTAGRFPTLAETYLGLRHGPMTFVRQDTLVLCLLSNDSHRRRYELDLIRELRAKNLGRLVAIGATTEEEELFDEVIPAIAPGIRDELRTPFEIVASQLLGYHLSLRLQLDPDNPSEGGIITRVVQGVVIHED